MSPGESHQISAAGIAPFELAEEVSHSRIGIGQGEREAISLASRGERHGHGVALQFNRGWAVSKHDGHRKFPQQFKMLRACRNSVLALIAPSPGEGQVPVFRNCSRLADIPNNHPVDKVMSQGMSYGQAPNFLGIRRVGHPLPPACSPEPSEQATRVAAVQIPPFGDCCGASRFAAPDLHSTAPGHGSADNNKGAMFCEQGPRFGVSSSRQSRQARDFNSRFVGAFA